MVYESATETYKGHRINLAAGYLGVPGTTYRMPGGLSQPRRYGWVYDVKIRSLVICNAPFDTKDEALEDARREIDRHT